MRLETSFLCLLLIVASMSVVPWAVWTSGVSEEPMPSLISDHVVINAFAWTTSATFGGHYVYDLILEWGGYGDNDGHFNNPSSIAVDSQDNVYVADKLNNRVQKFTSSGIFVTKWGTNGWADGQFQQPQGIAVDKDGYVYVSDSNGGNNIQRIQKFDSNGAFVTKWMIQEGAHFASPIAVDSGGCVYVLDSYQVQKFASDGTFVIKWGHYGAEDGEFEGSNDIAVDPSGGYVYVADNPTMPLQGGVARIQKFTLSGGFVAKWFIPGFQYGVYEVAVGPTGNVYAGDNTWSRSVGSIWDVVEEFTPDGTFIAKIDIARLANRESALTSDIAVDSNSNLYVLESSISSLKGPVLKFGLVLRHPPNAPTDPACSCNVIGCSNGETPFFSWKFSDTDPGDTMAAWEIQISTGPDGTGTLLWDSGKQYSDNQHGSTVNGNPGFYYYGSFQFSRGVAYHWRVKAWDKYDLEGPYSADQTFMIGSATTTLISTSASTSTLSTSTSTGTTSPTTTTQTQTSTTSAATSTVSTATTTMSVIRGTVYWFDQYGNLHPLAWAQVAAFRPGGLTVVTSSGTDGTYVMHVVPGTYVVTASLDPGFIPQSQNVGVPAGSTVIVDFELMPGCTTCTTTTTQSQTTTAQSETTTSGVTTSTVIYTTTVFTAAISSTVGLQMQVVSNSTVSGLVFDSAKGLLNFTVSGPTGTYGFFDATIAKTLLSGQPIVMIDGMEHPASVTEDANFWYIHVTYSHSEHQIIIGGSNTIPEFPSIPLLIVTFVLIISIFSRRRKH